MERRIGELEAREKQLQDLLVEREATICGLQEKVGAQESHDAEQVCSEGLRPADPAAATAPWRTLPGVCRLPCAPPPGPTTNPSHPFFDGQELRHQRQIQQMQAAFEAMLKDTLEKLQQRLEERHTRAV